MDTLERNQVSLILDHLSSETMHVATKKLEAIKAERAARGCLQSGGTIKCMVEVSEDLANTFIENAIAQVSNIAQNSASFDAIASSLTEVIRGLWGQVQTAIMLSVMGEYHRLDGAAIEGEQLFDDCRARIIKRLEVHRFSFTKPSNGDLAAQNERTSTGTADSVQSTALRNAGGKPLAAHWDAMWATISVKLWTGELQPKSQADVKRAMIDWFNEAEIDIGDTALTQRARQLWQAMEEVRRSEG